MEIRIKKNNVLVSQEGRSFLSDCYYRANGCKKPLVVFVHGYKGFKDWGPWDLVAEAFAELGFFFVKFNFSLNGTTISNPLEFDDLDAFGRNTYSQEQRDLQSVIDFYKDNNEVDSNRIYLIGHSRGGGAVLLQAYHNSDVRGVVTWAGVSNFKKRFPQGARFDAWKTNGVFYTLNGRTKQEMPHYFSYYEDYVANEEALDVQYAAQHLKKPTLIVHGTADEAVSEREADLLLQWIKGADGIKIKNGNHVFGGKHPWEEKKLPHDLQDVVNHTVNFINIKS